MPHDAALADADDALVARVAGGDGRAWQAIVDRHSSSILASAWYVLGDRSEAEDVAQETFIRLMSKAGTWQAGGPKLRTWLYRVAVNLCIDRKRQRRTAPLEEAEAHADPSTGEGPVGHKLDVTRAVSRAMAKLPERQRVAMTLVHYQGMNNIEAADVLSVSVDALESLLARARKTMRDTLAPERGDLLGEA
jgi:RNA polymerase sigma-70 factor, ECF subfamily